MAQISIFVNYKDFVEGISVSTINKISNNLKNDKYTAKTKSTLRQIYLYVLSKALGVKGTVAGKTGYDNVGVASGMLKESLKAKSDKTKAINKTQTSVTGVFTTKLDLSDDSYGWYIGSNNEGDYGKGGSDIVDKLTEWIKYKKSKGATFTLEGKGRYKDDEERSIASNIAWSWRKGTSSSRLVLPFWYNMEETKNPKNRKELEKQIQEKMPIIVDSLSNLLK